MWKERYKEDFKPITSHDQVNPGDLVKLIVGNEASWTRGCWIENLKGHVFEVTKSEGEFVTESKDLDVLVPKKIFTNWNNTARHGPGPEEREEYVVCHAPAGFFLHCKKVK